MEAIKAALAALDTLACHPNHANRQEVALDGWNALHDAFGVQLDAEVIIAKVKERAAEVAAPSPQALREFIVLYREIDGDDDEPFGFSCLAEDSDHAEEQCLDAQEGIELVWSFEGNSLEAALESYHAVNKEDLDD